MSVSIPEVDADASDGFNIPEPDTDLSEAERHIRQWIEGKVEKSDTPHRDPDVLMHYYWDREMSQAETGDELGCSQETVGRWLDKTDIGARTISEAKRVERATFNPATRDGHEVWTVRDPDGKTTVGVHQLLAVADGADPHDVWNDDTHVHHKAGIPWLNLPGFVEVLTRGEHKRTHVADEWTTERGLPVLQTQD